MERTRSIIKNITDKLLNTIYVKDIKCINCNCELDSDKKYCICDKCFSKIVYNNKLVCRKCGIKLFGDIDICPRCIEESVSFKQAFSVFTYEGVMKDIVKQFKFCGKKYIGEYLSKFLYEKFLTLNIDCDMVIPVPLHKKSFKKRGYNQTLELCKSFEGILPIRIDILFKIKKTKEQAQLNFKQRSTNLEKCYFVENNQDIKGKTILLIDDIFTTGNTANECCKILKSNGAKAIYVLTLCSAVFNKIERVNWNNSQIK